MAGKKFLKVLPPPKEKGLYRVVYVIDICADSFMDAAKKTEKIMTDTDSLAPVLEIIDQDSQITVIDLSKKN